MGNLCGNSNSGHVIACRTTYANTKGADQTVHPHSLIISFIVRCLDTMVYILVKSSFNKF